MKSLRSLEILVNFGVLVLLGVMVPNDNALAQNTKTFTNPTVEDHRLDWCLHWGRNCGKPAADAWCAMTMAKADGHAVAWKEAVNIGAGSATYVMGDKRICDQRFCDGFAWIKCEYSLE